MNKYYRSQYAAQRQHLPSCQHPYQEQHVTFAIEMRYQISKGN